MKKITTLIAAILLASATHAQIEKGTVVLGGGFNLSGYSTKADNNTSFNSGVSFNLYPEVGFVPAKNIVVGFVPGINVGYSLRKNINAGINYRSKFRNYGIEPQVFARWYKLFKNKVGIYGQFNTGFGMSWQNLDVSTGPDVQTFNGYSYFFNITPGFVWFATDKIGLHISYGQLGYILTLPYDNAAKKQDGVSHNVMANFNLSSLNVGLRVFLGKKEAKAE